MIAQNAFAILNSMQCHCKKKKLGLLIVGSVAYSGALLSPGIFSQCDDIDCVFVYNDLEQLEDCPFFHSPDLFPCARRHLANGTADMFSSKPILEDIQISADFISMSYLARLAAEKFEHNDSFRVKLTDTKEKPDNEYRSFTGKSYVFHKNPINLDNLFFYSLPIRLWKNNEYYTGALYNKFIHNPRLLVEVPGLSNLHAKLLRGYSEHFQRCVRQNPKSKLLAAMLFRDRFSADTISLMEKLECLRDEEEI